MSGAKGRSGGHNKLPTELKSVRGTEKPSRVRVDEPTPTAGLPTPPPYLTMQELEEYHRLGLIIQTHLNVTTLADGDSLALAACALVEYINARKDIEEKGRLIELPTITVRETKRVKTTRTTLDYMKNPMISTAENAWVRFRNALRSFGMDPQSRSSVSVVNGKEEKSEFFN